MQTLSLALPDQLIDFVDKAVAAQLFTSREDLLAYAVNLVKLEVSEGRLRKPEVVHAAQVPNSAVLPDPTPMKPKSGPIATVDMTREGFDSSSFIAGLVGRINEKAVQDRHTAKSKPAKSGS